MVFFSNGFAPYFSNSWTTSLEPLLDAKCSGVKRRSFTTSTSICEHISCMISTLLYIGGWCNILKLHTLQISFCFIWNKYLNFVTSSLSWIPNKNRMIHVFPQQFLGPVMFFFLYFVKQDTKNDFYVHTNTNWALKMIGP